MKKTIAILAGEPNSISSEIIFKIWKLRKKFKSKPFFVIGSINLLNMQKEKLKFNLKIKEIEKNFTYKDLIGNKLPVYNVDYFQKKAFQKVTEFSNKYIFQCFETAIYLIKRNKLSGFINCPISKEHLLKNKYRGITEYIAKKTNCYGKEVMLIYNSKLSVLPITTHIPIKKISSSLKKINIINKVKTAHNFYKNKLKRKVKIGILGLNPHNFSGSKKSEENEIIIPAINFLKKNKIKVTGPISPDTSFLIIKKLNLDIIVGMYHDQVLIPYKMQFGFNAINITLGLPFIRVTPDHGIGQDILGRKKANVKSLIEAIKFFNLIK